MDRNLRSDSYYFVSDRALRSIFRPWSCCQSPAHIPTTACSHDDDISDHTSVWPPQSTPSPPVAMASDNRASLLPFAAAVLVVLLAGGAAADDASSDDDAGTSRTPGCSNKFQLVMDLPCPLLTRFAVLLH
jgi:hypothetical protein